MVIDFHTHIFPDSLAPRAMSVLLKNGGSIYAPVTDMTLSSLVGRMDEWGIDLSVVQPVVTKPSQTVTTNKWAQSILSERIISFGGVHPDTDDFKRDIDFIVSLGLKGLKFHAEYQNFILDEPRMLRIYDYALSKGLILLHHGGFDPDFPPPFKTSPRQFANIAKEMRGGVIIAAHLGGHDQWDDVERYIVGTDIYLDTSMGFGYYSEEQFLRILKAHGSEKILFASDSPWSNAHDELERIRSLPVSEAERENILYKNAASILGLNM